MVDKIDKILEENLNWKTRSSFFSYIRGGIRSGLWNKSPIKLNYIKEKRIQIPNPNERGNKPTVWGAECNICEGLFPLKDMNVDHIRDTGVVLKLLTIYSNSLKILSLSLKMNYVLCVKVVTILNHIDRNIT